MATDIKSKKQHIEGILGEKIADEALALIQWWRMLPSPPPHQAAQRRDIL